MREQFLELMRNLKSVNVAETANFKMLIMLADAPNAIYPNKHVVASKIKINVNDEFMADKELLGETLDTYIGCLNKIWLQLKAQYGSMVAEAMMLNIVGEMSITYTF